METRPAATPKVHLTEEKSTLFITLHAKASDYRSKKSILNDRKADEIVRSIDYDFDKVKAYGFGSVLAVRAKQMDEWIKDFLQSNSNAIVLNLGCGLDTRVTRINPPSTVTWFDVDYPEVIELRKNFYTNSERYKMIESSHTASGWLEKIPNDEPAIIIAEGVLEYITEEDVKKIINRLTEHFSGGQIIFDVMSSYAVNSGKENLKKTMGAEHKWGVDDIGDVDKMDDKLKRISTLPLSKSKFMKEIPVIFKVVFGLMNLIPRFKNMIHVLRYDF